MQQVALERPGGTVSPEVGGLFENVENRSVALVMVQNGLSPSSPTGTLEDQLPHFQERKEALLLFSVPLIFENNRLPFTSSAVTSTDGFRRCYVSESRHQALTPSEDPCS